MIYAHGLCFAMLCCGLVVNDSTGWHIHIIRITSTEALLLIVNKTFLFKCLAFIYIVVFEYNIQQEHPVFVNISYSTETLLFISSGVLWFWARKYQDIIEHKHTKTWLLCVSET